MKVVSLLGRIHILENKKWDLILNGAEFRPELRAQIELIDSKLDKLYNWYAKAFLSGTI